MTLGTTKAGLPRQRRQSAAVKRLRTIDDRDKAARRAHAAGHRERAEQPAKAAAQSRALRAANHAKALKLASAALDPERVEQLKDWASANPADAQAQAKRFRQLRIAVARRDVNEFIEFVARDAETGAVVHQEPIHEEFQRLASEHPRLVLWSHIESGKTTQLSIMRVLWELGRNPNLRVAIVSATAGKAAKIATTIKEYIERSAELREVFPHLRPGKRWGASSFTVQRDSYSKDFSVQAIGVQSDIIGARIDLAVLDDMMTSEMASSPTARAKLEAWLKSSILGRLTRKARVIMVGTAWNPDDLMHTRAKVDGWRGFKFPVIDPDTGALTWPDRWDHERIAAQTRDFGPLETARQLYCQARDDGEARFKREWIEACLARGEGRMPTLRLAGLPPGYRTFTGVDLGARTHKKADLTVLFSIVVHPDETREVLCVESGRWTGPEILERVYDHHDRYGSIVLVENNAAQDYLLQFARAESAVPIKPFHTGKNKVDVAFGVESMAVEMFNAKWIIPNIGGACAEAIGAWVNEMLFYLPGAHTGDHLMASWFAREGARQVAPKKKRVRTGRVNMQAR